LKAQSITVVQICFKQTVITIASSHKAKSCRLYFLMSYTACLCLILTASNQVKTKTEMKMRKTETKLKRTKTAWNGNEKILQNGNETETWITR